LKVIDVVGLGWDTVEGTGCAGVGILKEGLIIGEQPMGDIGL